MTIVGGRMEKLAIYLGIFRERIRENLERQVVLEITAQERKLCEHREHSRKQLRDRIETEKSENRNCSNDHLNTNSDES